MVLISLYAVLSIQKSLACIINNQGEYHCSHYDQIMSFYEMEKGVGGGGGAGLAVTCLHFRLYVLLGEFVPNFALYGPG